jgi:hypothetical protein
VKGELEVREDYLEKTHQFLEHARVKRSFRFTAEVVFLLPVSPANQNASEGVTCLVVFL